VRIELDDRAHASVGVLLYPLEEFMQLCCRLRFELYEGDSFAVRNASSNVSTCSVDKRFSSSSGDIIQTTALTFIVAVARSIVRSLFQLAQLISRVDPNATMD